MYLCIKNRLAFSEHFPNISTAQNVSDVSAHFCHCYFRSEIYPRKRPICKAFKVLFCHGIQEVSGSIPLISTRTR